MIHGEDSYLKPFEKCLITLEASKYDFFTVGSYLSKEEETEKLELEFVTKLSQLPIPKEKGL